jgi:protein involved in polysaccharide export with SLBB domain
MRKILGFMLRRLGAVSGCLALALVLIGCATGGGSEFADFPNGAPVGTNGSPQAPIDPTELISVGDSLTIIFSDIPNGPTIMDQQVKQDGTITLLLNEQFTAVGKSRGHLANEIRTRYVPRYYVNMTVTIKPQDRYFFVGGEVKQPSRQVYVGRITVTRAIQSCGDFTDFANKHKVRVTRINGKSKTIDCIKALEDPALDLEVFPGDKIHVPRKIL